MTLTDTTRRKIVIIGGGLAGISALSTICKQLRYPNVTLIEPSAYLEYSPLWPMLAVGLARPEETRRERKYFLPEGSRWIRDTATKIEQNDHLITLSDKSQISFEYAIICTGLEKSFGKIKGIDEALDGGGAFCIYGHDEALHARDALEAFTGGTILLAQPLGAMDDGVTWQYALLLDHVLRERGLREQTQIVYLTASGEGKLHRYGPLQAALSAQAKAKNIEIKHSLSLVKIDGKQAEFGVVDQDKQKVTKEVESFAFDLLHVAPLQEPGPLTAKNRKIAAARGDHKGKLDVDLQTLRQPSYPTIFGAGSVLASDLPLTARGQLKQGPIAASNAVRAMQGQGAGLFDKYQGESAFHLATEPGKMSLFEWGYADIAPEASPSPEAAPANALQWWLARHIHPRMLWQGIGF